MSGDIFVSIFASPPDRRKRDLDNIRKCVYDALSDRVVKGKVTHKGIMADDCQIKRDAAEMLPYAKGEEGSLIVTVSEIKNG